MNRRPVNKGLFHGVWTDLQGRKIRRVRRDEYPELYRLHRQHRDIRLGLTPVGFPPNMGGLMTGAGLEAPAPSTSSYRHGNLNGDAA